MKTAQTLNDLYPTGTTLSDVAPDFRGMSLVLWQKLHLSEQAEEWRQSRANIESPLERKSIWTPRDDYGMKGL
jgi:hypothetical protein